MGAERRNRVMCWFGGQYVLEELGADIGTFGCWCTGESHLGGRERRGS